jgi:hypothetical protein
VIRNATTNNATQFDIIANDKVGIIVSPGNGGSIGGAGFGE